MVVAKLAGGVIERCFNSKGTDQLVGGGRKCKATGISIVWQNVFRNKITEVDRRRRLRSPTENKLVRRKARALVSLERVIGKCVRLRHCQIRCHVLRIHIIKSRVRRRRTIHCPCSTRRCNQVVTIHRTLIRDRVQIAKVLKRSMRMADIVVVKVAEFPRRAQVNRLGLRDAASNLIVQPVAGLNLELSRGCRRTAHTRRSVRRDAQTIKEIIRGAIFLENNNHVRHYSRRSKRQRLRTIARSQTITIAARHLNRVGSTRSGSRS